LVMNYEQNSFKELHAPGILTKQKADGCGGLNCFHWKPTESIQFQIPMPQAKVRGYISNSCYAAPTRASE